MLVPMLMPNKKKNKISYNFVKQLCMKLFTVMLLKKKKNKVKIFKALFIF